MVASHGLSDFIERVAALHSMVVASDFRYIKGINGDGDFADYHQQAADECA